MINNSARALWHESVSQSSLREESAPAGDLIPIKACYSMVSTGTEKLVASGGLSTSSDKENISFQDKMSVQHQQGSFDLPIKYGYSLVGRTPENALVHLMHPHQSIAWAKSEQLFNVPSDVSPEAAALISNMETIVNALWDAELLFNAADLKLLNTAVVGFGNIGALLALTLRKAWGIEATIMETNPWRQQKALELGFEVCSSDKQAFDLLFHSTGQGAGLNWCLSRAQTEGVIIDLSWYGSQLVDLSLGREFHYQRLRLISSQVSKIPGHKKHETYLSRKQRCAELLADPIYQQLISQKVPFQQAPQFFAALRTNQLPPGLIWLFAYDL